MEKISASKKAFVVALVFASGLAFYGACFVRPPGANSNIHVGEDQAQLPSAPRAEIAGVTERLTNESTELVSLDEEPLPMVDKDSLRHIFDEELSCSYSADKLHASLILSSCKCSVNETGRSP